MEELVYMAEIKKEHVVRDKVNTAWVKCEAKGWDEESVPSLCEEMEEGEEMMACSRVSSSLLRFLEISSQLILISFSF